MRQTIKSYCKIEDFGADASGIIELTDTDGNLLECNYLSVESNTTLATIGYVHIIPSSVYLNDVDLSATSGAGDLAAGGGVVFQTGGGPIEISSADAHRFKAIKVVCYDSAAKLIFNYGVIQHGNPLRDNQRPIGA
jgi:hypothetical protein